MFVSKEENSKPQKYRAETLFAEVCNCREISRSSASTVVESSENEESENSLNFEFESESDEEANESDLCSNCRNSIQFVTSAENGIEPAELDGPRLKSLKSELKLDDEEKFSAFLQFYGFWLGSGFLHYNQINSMPAFICSPVNSNDSIWLKEIISSMGLNESEWTNELNQENNNSIQIQSERFVKYFSREYGEIYLKNENISQNKISNEWNEKISKYFLDWSLKCLNSLQSQLILYGLQRSENHLNLKQNIFTTSSIQFRDEICRLIFHCGFSPDFVRDSRDLNCWRVTWFD